MVNMPWLRVERRSSRVQPERRKHSLLLRRLRRSATAANPSEVPAFVRDDDGYYATLAGAAYVELRNDPCIPLSELCVRLQEACDEPMDPRRLTRFARRARKLAKLSSRQLAGGRH